ncbi:MAG: hypothetical protein ACREDY_24900 [Bradyrhizobium sp.]
MLVQRFGAALGFLAAVLIVPTHKIAVAAGIVLAQATQQAGTATKKTKPKVKEKKTGTTTTQSQPPPVHVGPPDPGKY